MFNLKDLPIFCSSLLIVGALLIATSLFLPDYAFVINIIGSAMIIMGFLPLKNHCRKILKGLI